MSDQPNDRGICGAHTEPEGIMRAATCELLHGHTGWHRDGGMSWVDRSYDPDERERAAYERGKAEGRSGLVEHVARILGHDLVAGSAADAEDVLTAALGTARQLGIGTGRQQGIAEGLRQATEGWEREYAVRYPDGYVYDDVTEDAAREIVARWPHRAVVSRLVGPWEPAEQPEPARTEDGV